jgi:hypothetical protein
MALVFAFTVIMPVGAAFAAEDNTAISGSYNYVKADDKVKAGIVRVKEDGMESGTNNIVIQLSLPDGVEFTDDSAAKKSVKDSTVADWISYDTSIVDAVYVENASSDYFELKLVGATTSELATGKSIASFDFGIENVSTLDIDDDFTGNLDVAVDVIGLTVDSTTGKESILWTDNDDVTIAKVSGGDVTVTVGDTKKVSVGGGAEVADITLEESMAGAFGLDEEVTLEIETDGVEFNSVIVDPTRLGIVQLDKDSKEGTKFTQATEIKNDFIANKDGELTKFVVKVKDVSQSLPGELKFDAIKLDIAPNVSGEIEISVTSNDSKGADLDETVTVATVGDVNAEVADIDDNDNVAYAGQDKDLDVEFDIKTTDGSNFEKGDMITFKLNNGEFKQKPKVEDSQTDVKLYDDDEAFYYTFPNDDKDEITVSDISIILDNDVEPGDLTLTIEGDYGDLGEVTIAQVAKPFTVTAEKVEIISEALGQPVGDIIITEADDGALKDGQFLYFEMPSGVELKGKPSIEVTEGSADADIADYEDDYFVVEITEESSSKPSTLRIYDIEYDTGKLALTGDVEVEVYGDIDENIPGKTESKVDKKDWDFDDDSKIASVVNATVVDQNAVTATFTVGDEGVVVKNGRVLVQVNTLCDVLGLQKSWDEVNKIAYFVKGGTVVAFPIDKNEISINGNVLPVDQGGTIIDGFTYATLRGLEMAFGGELDWDNETKTATFKF